VTQLISLVETLGSRKRDGWLAKVRTARLAATNGNGRLALEAPNGQG
jgi:hypothetical protein